MDERPQMLTQQMVMQALQSPSFRTQCPSFRSLPVPEPAPSVAGCAKCNKRAQGPSPLHDFFVIASTLTADEQQRLRQFFQVPKLMLSIRDPRTNAVTLKVV